MSNISKAVDILTESSTFSNICCHHDFPNLSVVDIFCSFDLPSIINTASFFRFFNTVPCDAHPHIVTWQTQLIWAVALSLFLFGLVFSLIILHILHDIHTRSSFDLFCSFQTLYIVLFHCNKSNWCQKSEIIDQNRVKVKGDRTCF